MSLKYAVQVRRNKLMLNYCKKHGIIRSSRVVKYINHTMDASQKRILFCYLDYMDAIQAIDKGASHTNQPRFFKMLHCFINLGLSIDVCSCIDVESAKELVFEEYDYIFGFGPVFDLACEKALKSQKIIYMTEDPFYVADKKEKERVAYFENRHNKKVPPRMTRAGLFYTKGQEKNADVIICQGQEEHFDDIHVPTYRIVPNAFKNEAFDNKTSQRDSHSFVMFGAAHHIRKGTDLLVDVFSKHPDWKLYLCDKGITENLRKLGYKSLPNNIVDCGFVQVQSDDLLELFVKCTYIILPSCTEAPGSAVLTGMRHGLIPIVSRNIGLDIFKDFCFYFDGYKIEDIENGVLKALDIGEEDRVKMSEKIYDYANREFTLERFAECFSTIMKDVIREG